jgi:serine/threonine-protein kinase RsbW
MMVELANDLSEIHRLADEVNAFCDKHSLDSRAAMHLNLVLEEIFTNVVTYAYDNDGDHVVHIRLEAAPEGIEGEVIDGGRPFNPLKVPPPDVESHLEDRRLGGLGVHFLRTLMTDLSYERRRGKNRLRFMKRFSAETGVT